MIIKTNNEWYFLKKKFCFVLNVALRAHRLSLHAAHMRSCELITCWYLALEIRFTTGRQCFAPNSVTKHARALLDPCNHIVCKYSRLRMWDASLYTLRVRHWHLLGRKTLMRQTAYSRAEMRACSVVTRVIDIIYGPGHDILLANRPTHRMPSS